MNVSIAATDSVDVGNQHLIFPSYAPKDPIRRYAHIDICNLMVE